MKSDIKTRPLGKRFYDKKNYEPLLLECLNSIPYFIEKSCGSFSAPKSESNGECDAIGQNGCSMDFKCLVSQEGAQNMHETSLQEEIIYPGITTKGPSKAFLRGKPSLPFPMLWAFLVGDSLLLNENNKIELVDKTDKHMNKTIISLNRMISTKKNLLFFLPCELVTESSGDKSIEVISNRAKKGSFIISKARRKVSPEWETYYALLINNEMVLFAQDFTHMGSIELISLDTWKNCISR